MTTATKQGLLEKLNGQWHERALWIYLAIVILHWTEHLFQAAQIWVLGMPRPEALGALGYVFPWLVKSEAMHFTYAVLMFAGLVLLRPGFRGTAKTGWTVPTSIVQQVVPRPELHLLYNLAVFVPMIVAMWLHTRPNQAAVNQCSCADSPVRMEQAGMTGA